MLDLTRRLFVLTALALALVVVSPGVALAGPIVERAAAALAGDPVYVDPAAGDALDDSGADRLRDRVADVGAGPTYIAVLPEEAANEAGGDPEGVARLLFMSLRRPGTYAVIVGERLSAGNTNGRVADLADEAVAANQGAGAEAVLSDFIGRVGERRREGRGSGSRDGNRDGGGGSGVLVLLGLVGVGAGAVALSNRRRRKLRQQREAEEVEEVREFARDDLVALGDDIRSLDLDVEMPGVDPAAKEDYGQAVRSYDTANQALERARRPEDMEEVTASLEQGRYAMASAKARFAGKEPPERRPPCFFDPRHGPSDRDVDWSPDGGLPRPVPACAADALRIEEGHAPAAREVMLGGRSTPYWNAGPAYGPWAGGFYGGMGGGLLPGLLIGSALGGGLGYGFGGGFGADEAMGGDFGGGDFGGGDFGGGDFGGGDFGGGDFGGGGDF